MPLYADRTMETSTTTGTGTVTLGGAAVGYQAFSAAVNDGDRVSYCITDETNWEVGDGVYALSGTTLTRENVYASSNAGALVNWAAGTRKVFLTAPGQSVPTLGLALASHGQWFIP